MKTPSSAEFVCFLVVGIHFYFVEKDSQSFSLKFSGEECSDVHNKKRLPRSTVAFRLTPL